jgi:hypothetical protein
VGANDSEEDQYDSDSNDDSAMIRVAIAVMMIMKTTISISQGMMPKQQLIFARHQQQIMLII